MSKFITNLVILLFFITSTNLVLAQKKDLSVYEEFFKRELKPWTSTITKFKLAAFSAQDTILFENNFEQDFNTYDEFLSIYKPIIAFSPDNSTFIDIYSYQLNLEKKGDHFEATPEIDQTIFLCEPNQKYWNRIYFGGGSRWIDEVAWFSKTKFFLVGITKSEDERKQPLILLGDIVNRTLISYASLDTNIFQRKENYLSPKLEKMKLKGL